MLIISLINAVFLKANGLHTFSYDLASLCVMNVCISIFNYMARQNVQSNQTTIARFTVEI